MEGIARQPEMLPALRVQMFITAGLMESFPFIVLAFAMYFTFANPFVAAALETLKTLAG
jgi:F-type H+-transporting ATPase subunit c